MKTLYIHRPLLNSQKVIEWFKNQGFESTLEPNDMHVTIAYSKTPVDWEKVPKSNVMEYVNRPSVKRTILPLGDKGAIVLKFEAEYLSNRWKELIDAGCSWDYPSYQSHVTISYKGGPVDCMPYCGELVFGPEKWEQLDENWDQKVKES